MVIVIFTILLPVHEHRSTSLFKVLHALCMYLYSIFDHILSPPQGRPDLPYIPTNPTSCSFSLLLSPKKSKQKANQTKNNKSPPTYTHTKAKNANTTKKCGVHFVLATFSWPRGLPWTAVGAPAGTSLEKTDCPFPAGVDCQTLLVKSGTVCLLFLLWGGIFSGLNLCRVCSCYTCLCESTCVLVLLCLEDTIFLELFTASTSYNMCHVDP